MNNQLWDQNPNHRPNEKTDHCVLEKLVFNDHKHPQVSVEVIDDLETSLKINPNVYISIDKFIFFKDLDVLVLFTKEILQVWDVKTKKCIHEVKKNLEISSSVPPLETGYWFIQVMKWSENEIILLRSDGVMMLYSIHPEVEKKMEFTTSKNVFQVHKISDEHVGALEIICTSVLSTHRKQSHDYFSVFDLFGNKVFTIKFSMFERGNFPVLKARSRIYERSIIKSKKYPKCVYVNSVGSNLSLINHQKRKVENSFHPCSDFRYGKRPSYRNILSVDLLFSSSMNKELLITGSGSCMVYIFDASLPCDDPLNDWKQNLLQIIRIKDQIQSLYVFGHYLFIGEKYLTLYRLQISHNKLEPLDCTKLLEKQVFSKPVSHMNNIDFFGFGDGDGSVNNSVDMICSTNRHSKIQVLRITNVYNMGSGFFLELDMKERNEFLLDGITDENEYLVHDCVLSVQLYDMKIVVPKMFFL